MTDEVQYGSVPDAAALVVRVWRDPDDANALRARVTRRPDLGTETETSVVVTSPDAVYREVRAWLEAFVGRGS